MRSNLTVQSSYFKELGTNSTKGGAIQIKDSSSTIEFSIFERNYAEIGGSISIECEKSCENKILNSTFQMNKAEN